jgi:hypothetical protein
MDETSFICLNVCTFIQNFGMSFQNSQVFRRFHLLKNTNTVFMMNDTGT